MEEILVAFRTEYAVGSQAYDAQAFNPYRPAVWAELRYHSPTRIRPELIGIDPLKDSESPRTCSMCSRQEMNDIEKQ